MRHVHTCVMLTVGIAGADGAHAKDVEAGLIDGGNRAVRLVGVGQVPTVSFKGCAKFVELEPNAGTEIYVAFSLGRVLSGAKTTVGRNHVSTVVDIISASRAGRGDRRTPFTEIDWREPQFEVIFSIPKDAQGEVSDFSHWYLVSIRPSATKKEQPKAAENSLPGAGRRTIFAGPENRAVKLVGVRSSQSHRQDLLVKFAEIGASGEKEIELSLGDAVRSTPGEAIVNVSHGRTIRNIIHSSASWKPLPAPSFDVPAWREPLFEVIFSIPKDAHGHVTDFTRWSLLSIELPQARKEQPKASDK